MKILFAAATALLVLRIVSPSLHAQTTLAGWTFDNDTAATNLNPAPSTDLGGRSVSAASIGMTGTFASGNGTNAPDVTTGKSGDTGSNGVADLTNEWRIRATGGTGVNGWSNQAPIGTQGAQFNVDTTGFGDLTVSFDWYSTSAGEANLQLQYTTNGTSWINTPVTLSGSDSGATIMTNSTDANLVTGSYVHGFGGSGGQEWFTALTASILDPNAANDPNFGIRMVNAATGADDVTMTGAAENNTSGNWRFDNVSVSSQTQAVPEPGGIATLALGLGVLVLAARSRRVLGA